MTMNNVSTSKVLLSAAALAVGLTGCETEPTGTEPPRCPGADQLDTSFGCRSNTERTSASARPRFNVVPPLPTT